MLINATELCTCTATVSKAPAPKQAPKKFQSYDPKFKTAHEKKEEVIHICDNQILMQLVSHMYVQLRI